MAYIYAISDIHARVDLLKEIVNAKIDLDNKNNKLVLCGDYIEGEEGYNSFECLLYLFRLQKKYPNQVIVLKGNHEEWLLHWLFGETLLEMNLTPQFSVVQDFMDQTDFRNIYIDARHHATNNLELARYIYQQCRVYILDRHHELIEWMKDLPFYYESDYNQIFVHAGVFEMEENPKLWKVYSSFDDYLMKFTVEKGKFFKDVIAGHIATSQIVGDPSFNDICCYGNHYYLDSSVIFNRKLNLLKYDIENQCYYGIYKTDRGWLEEEIEER